MGVGMTRVETFGPLHGGPDARGAVPHDFSTNGNACGPCADALQAVQQADASLYPDPLYMALRERLARFHGVEARRIVIAASASEFIGRITAAVARRGGRRVRVPAHCYGDYLRAASAWGFEQVAHGGADLAWCCEPSSPLGQPCGDMEEVTTSSNPKPVCVLDLAYEPLRLEGALSLPNEKLEALWQLWTPNKALGMTGVRAAYAIAPLDADDLTVSLTRLAPSWPLGAHGVAFLESWTTDAVQHWLRESRTTLRLWKTAQWALCESLGWTCLPSLANYFCASPDVPYSEVRAEVLRAAGIKLRDTASFGLPGHVRLGVLPPGSQEALRRAWY